MVSSSVITPSSTSDSAVAPLKALATLATRTWSSPAGWGVGTDLGDAGREHPGLVAGLHDDDRSRRAARHGDELVERLLQQRLLVLGPLTDGRVVRGVATGGQGHERGHGGDGHHGAGATTAGHDDLPSIVGVRVSASVSVVRRPGPRRSP